MKASVVITTRNRRDDLARALRSCRDLVTEHELIVVDDGSTDGTSDLVAEAFPHARLIRHDVSAGLIARRNEAFFAATGDVIFSIDDDAAFSSPQVVRQTLDDFDADRIAVVAIPLIEPNHGTDRLQTPPDARDLWVTDSFKGTAFAVRREVFVEMGGFRADLVHQGEETDLAIRLLDRGYVVRLGRSDPIIHYESPKRDHRRMDYFGRRNDVLFAFRNVPGRDLVVHLAGTTWNGLRSAGRASRRGAMLRGLVKGWAVGLSQPGARQPVRRTTYRAFRRLRTGGAAPYRNVAEWTGQA